MQKLEIVDSFLCVLFLLTFIYVYFRSPTCTTTRTKLRTQPTISRRVKTFIEDDHWISAHRECVNNKIRWLQILAHKLGVQFNITHNSLSLKDGIVLQVVLSPCQQTFINRLHFFSSFVFVSYLWTEFNF